MWGVWLAVYLPAAVLLHAVFRQQPVIAALVLWWLKPVFDRVVLHVVAPRGVRRAADASARRCAAWREILRRGSLAGLLWV